MPDRSLARQRLVAQGLVTKPYATPLDAVASFGLMQGQDLTGVLASTALRTQSGSIDAVLAALGSQLMRGYPMRGTVFLAPAADLRWMTELCAGPSLRAAHLRREKHHDFGVAEIERTYEAFVAAAPGRGVSRAQYMDLLRANGIEPDQGRGYHILFTLIADGRLAYGPWNGTDQQIVLAEEYLGDGIEERFGGDEIEAIAELAGRYFRTHGPATVRDFAWWTKLPLQKIRKAVTLLPADIETLGDETYVRAGVQDELAALGRKVQKPLLLPGFDEYILGYQDRLFAMDAATHDALVPGNNGVFKKSVVVDGIVRAFWSRMGSPKKRRLNVTELTTIPKAAEAGIRQRFKEYPFTAE